MLNNNVKLHTVINGIDLNHAMASEVLYIIYHISVVYVVRCKNRLLLPRQLNLYRPSIYITHIWCVCEYVSRCIDSQVLFYDNVQR